MGRKPAAFILGLSVISACGGGATPSDGGSDLGADSGGAHDSGAPDLGTDSGAATDLGALDAGADLGADAGCTDADHDGHGAIACGGDDCDDTVISIHPGAPEVCDGADDNCNGMIDEGVASTYYRDLDGDGFGDTTMSRVACASLAGYALTPGDCDDTMPSIHPGATDTCDCLDNDCDGSVDPGCSCSACGGGGATMQPCGTPDGSGGFLAVGACHPGTQTCTAGTWGVCTGSVSPLAESCNGVDDNCDGTVDEGVSTTFFRDADGDGHGDSSMPMAACGAPAGYALVAGDCDDARAQTYPGAPETCNGIDDNCNALVDEGVTTTYYRDADGDGYGSASMTVVACSLPAGYVPMPGDCNDANAAVHPGAADVCDGIDNNCDGTADPGCGCVNGTTQPCGTSDGMGGFLSVGVCHPGTQTCAAGAWGSCTGSASPVAESCNGLDDDCDGVVDDGVLTDYYRDCDVDGYGATGSAPMSRCTAPSTPPACGGPSGTWVANALDCNDTASAVHPAAAETCNGVDDDCDTVIDGAAASTWCTAHAMPPRCVAGTCVP